MIELLADFLGMTVLMLMIVMVIIAMGFAIKFAYREFL